MKRVPAELVTLVRDSTQCRVCFERSAQLRPALVDLAQPPFVPPGYWETQPRVLIIGQNPGAGASRTDGADDEMRRLLISLRDGRDSAWDDYTEHCVKDVRKWGQYLIYLRALDLDSLGTALGNVAMCAVETDDQVTDAIFTECSSRFLLRWVSTLAPDLVILMGKRAQAVRNIIAAAVPREAIRESMHYAVGGSHRARLNAQLAEIAADIRLKRVHHTVP